jgi:GNAT superfamily N-acetyltransferase
MDHPDFFIRPATNQDIPSVKAVVFTVLREYGLVPDENGKDSDLSDIGLSYFSDNGFFGVLVGRNTNIITATFGLFPVAGHICELRKMYLLKPERGRGLGKFILTTALQIARERGYMKVVLETISPLKEAISLYQKYGFREVPPKQISNRVDRAFELDLK